MTNIRDILKTKNRDTLLKATLALIYDWNPVKFDFGKER